MLEQRRLYKKVFCLQLKQRIFTNSDAKKIKIRCTGESSWLCTEFPEEEIELNWTMWSNNPEENPPFHDAAKV